MGLRAVLASTVAAGLVVAGCVSLSHSPDSHALHCRPHSAELPGSNGRGSSHRGQGSGHDQRVVVDASCNTVELLAPDRSRYVPDIASASRADRARARALLRGTNAFCRTHSAAELKTAHWWPGTSNPSKPTHLFNPDPRSRGLDPANPRAALVYQGKLAGVMFTGRPLPSLGSIPRAHIHDMSMPVEMVHVYCTPNLGDAFTPNRQLGVMAAVRSLRQAIRPAVSALHPPQLGTVRAAVKGYAGASSFPSVTPRAPQPGGPDPVLQARRTQVRLALMVLREPQLRDVWSTIRSLSR
jgi:hypothetical protein